MYNSLDYGLISFGLFLLRHRVAVNHFNLFITCKIRNINKIIVSLSCISRKIFRVI